MFVKVKLLAKKLRVKWNSKRLLTHMSGLKQTQEHALLLWSSKELIRSESTDVLSYMLPPFLLPASAALRVYAAKEKKNSNQLVTHADLGRGRWLLASKKVRKEAYSKAFDQRFRAYLL